jgi:preprotein translocase subunit YajC
MLYALALLAADEGGKQQPQQPNQPPGLEMLVFMAIALAFFWFVVLRPQRRRQEQERNALLMSLKKNDRVLTIAGIYGTVVSVSENEDEVTVKVDDNTRLKMTKSSIARNLSGEEAAREAKGTKADKEGGA